MPSWLGIVRVVDEVCEEGSVLVGANVHPDDCAVDDGVDEGIVLTRLRFLRCRSGERGRVIYFVQEEHAVAVRSHINDDARTVDYRGNCPPLTFGSAQQLFLNLLRRIFRGDHNARPLAIGPDERHDQCHEGRRSLVLK